MRQILEYALSLKTLKHFLSYYIHLCSVLWLLKDDILKINTLHFAALLLLIDSEVLSYGIFLLIRMQLFEKLKFAIIKKLKHAEKQVIPSICIFESGSDVFHCFSWETIIHWRDKSPKTEISVIIYSSSFHFIPAAVSFFHWTPIES